MSRLLSLLCLLTLVLAGCGSPAVATQVHQTTLRWGLAGLGDVPTLDPALASDPTSISIASLIYGGLVRLDDHLHVQPDGASHWTISGGGTVYTFTLRKNLRFADGRRATAADFVDALRRALGPEGSSGTAPFYLSLIAYPRETHKGKSVPGIQAIGRRRVRITLRRPAAHFLAELAFPASFVPDPAIARRYGQGWTDHAAGFGPYAVENWQHGNTLTLVANRYYYGGRPPLRRITLRFYQNTASALAAYHAHHLDLISGFQPGTTIGSHVAGLTRVPALALDYLAFNTSRLPFLHLNARRAFAALNLSRVAARTMGTSAFPALGSLPPALGISVPAWQPANLARTYLHLANHTNPVSTVTFAVPRNPRIYGLAMTLRTRWERALGVTVNLHQLNASTYGIILDAHAFDIAIVRWGADYPDPQDFLATQLGASSDNVTGWSSKQYTSLVATADAMRPEAPQRMSLFRQAASLAVRQVAFVPLDVPAQTAVIDPSLSGVHLTALGTVVGHWTTAGFR